ncbi:MAG: cell division protein FtsW [Candidatus Omnitrophota bacterium]|jgi:cell division protein FtsW
MKKGGALLNDWQRNTRNQPNKSRASSKYPARRLRGIILGTVATLLMLGAVMVFSSSAIHASVDYNDSLFYLKRHCLYLLLGFGLSIWVMMQDLKKYRSWAFIFAIIACGLLLYTSTMASSTHGARRWISIGAFSFQTSEFAKVVFLFYFAHYLSGLQLPLKGFSKDLMQPAIVLAIGAGSILLGRDFGSCAVLCILFFILIYVSGLPAKYFWRIALVVIPILLLAIWMEPYRRARLMTFMNPWEVARGGGFQLVQSLIAIGSGGWFGVGLGQSQQKLLYLPEAHNDFIFAIISEELGLVGAVGVIVLYSSFALFGWLLIKRLKDRFSRLFCLGGISLISIEAMINIGVNLGVLPTKGIVLPFISYGGSSLIARMILFAMILNLSREAVSSKP